MSYDAAADIIDITITVPGQLPYRTVTTAEAILRSDNERAKIFARSPQNPAMRYEDRGAEWKFERRKTCAES